MAFKNKGLEVVQIKMRTKKNINPGYAVVTFISMVSILIDDKIINESFK